MKYRIFGLPYIFFLVYLSLGINPGAFAHPLDPLLLDVHQSPLTPGRLEVSWKWPASSPLGRKLVPVFPEPCRRSSEDMAYRHEGATTTAIWEMDCGELDLIGSTFGIEGWGRVPGDVLFRFRFPDGGKFYKLLSETRPSVTIPQPQTAAQLVVEYLIWGIEHLLLGIDHVLFVCGLTLLIRNRRQLVLAITAFTVAHSITLAMTVLGIVVPEQRWIESLIAGSIVLVYVELLSGPEGLLQRSPALMAGGFGLLHGMGFAGALAKVGLPENDLLLALFSFNVGIETGQLAVVGVLALALSSLKGAGVENPVRLHRIMGYGAGIIGACWFWQRLAGVTGLLS